MNLPAATAQMSRSEKLSKEADMNREDIIKALVERGYPAEAYDVTKNGVTIEAIIMKTDSDIAPVIYTDAIIKDSSSLAEAVDRVVDIFEANQNPPIIIDDFHDPKWILDHITIGLQRSSDEAIVKRPCDLDGMEQYLYLSDSNKHGHYSIKVMPELLSGVGIDETKAWDTATEHLCADTQIVSLGKVLSDIIGTSYDDTANSDIKFHVITNSRQCRGAACIMNRDALRAFARKHRTNMLFVIPSSIHEMMIAPYDGGFKLYELSAMVKEINSAQVAPPERLTDRAYIICI